MRPSSWDNLSAGHGCCTGNQPPASLGYCENLRVTSKMADTSAPQSLLHLPSSPVYSVYHVMGRTWTPRQKIETLIQLFKLKDLHVGPQWLWDKKFNQWVIKINSFSSSFSTFSPTSQPRYHHHCHHQGLNPVDLVCKFSRGPAIVPKWKWPQRKRYTSID